MRILSGFSIHHTSLTVTITHYSNYAMYYNQLKIFQIVTHLLQEIKLDIARPYHAEMKIMGVLEMVTQV